MISRLLSIIILLLLGIGVLLYLFSDDLIRKEEEITDQVKKQVQDGVSVIESKVNEKKDESIESMMKEMQQILDKAQEAVREDVSS